MLELGFGMPHVWQKKASTYSKRERTESDGGLLTRVIENHHVRRHKQYTNTPGIFFKFLKRRREQQLIMLEFQILTERERVAWNSTTRELRGYSALEENKANNICFEAMFLSLLGSLSSIQPNLGNRPRF